METLILFSDNCEEHLQDYSGQAYLSKNIQVGIPKILNNFSVLEIQEIEECEEDEEELDEEYESEFFHSRSTDEME